MTPYEYARLKRMEDNNKVINALNLPILAQSLVKSSSATKKPSSGRSRFVQPGALEAANKTKFVVDDGDNKSYILTSIGRKWKDERCRLFKEHYKWDLPLEVNLANYPGHIDATNWALFVAYRRKPDTQKKARKNAANRKKLTTPHTLGKKSLARKKYELEVKDGREYSRGEMFSVSHKDSKGLYVNEEAKKKAEQLQIEMQNTPENEAFVKVFGKEHPGYVRSMGLGITPSQIFTSHHARMTSSFEANEKMLKMQAEIDSLKDKASQVDILKEQVAFLMQMQNSREKQPTNTESPRDGVCSSESSYRLENHEQHH